MLQERGYDREEGDRGGMFKKRGGHEQLTGCCPHCLFFFFHAFDCADVVKIFLSPLTGSSELITADR